MQERKTYAKGSTLESTTGYVVKVGMPVVDDTVKATSNGATFTENAPLTDGQYLVTIEVNGEAVAYKESVTADSGITVGDYSVAENAGKIVLTGASANDIVRLLIEPLEVSVSDGFRAAINKAVPKSEGGGSGEDNSFVITFDSTTKIGDKKKSEVFEAVKSGKKLCVVVGSQTYFVRYLLLQNMGAWSYSIYLIQDVIVGSDNITITSRSITSVYENSSDYVTLTVTKKKVTGLTIENA
jgi:hypothetical protein